MELNYVQSSSYYNFFRQRWLKHYQNTKLKGVCGVTRRVKLSKAYCNSDTYNTSGFQAKQKHAQLRRTGTLLIKIEK